MERKASIAMLALAVLTVGSAQAGDVSLSRVIVKVPDISAFIVDIPSLPTYQFCGDDDGCEIVMTMRMPDEARVSTARLFLTPNTGEWYSSELSTSYFGDGDLSVASVMRITADTFDCRVQDAEGASGDDVEGFRVQLTGPDLPASCTVVLSD